MPDRRVRLEAARLHLAHIGMATPDALHHALVQAAQVSARALGVDRVGVWLFHGEAILTCAVLWDAGADAEIPGPDLDLTAFPAYRAAISEARALRAEDAWADARTAELVDGYLAPQGIRAMLDVPIFLAGEIAGIVCHEVREGQGPRPFRDDDVDFATSVADMIAVLLGQEARLRAESALDAQAALVEELRRMEALGRLAAGVAHDFSNILLAVSLLAQKIERLGGGPAAEAARSIEVEADRGRRLVGQLLAFAREESARPSPVDVGAVVREMAPLLETIMTADHRVSVQTPAEAIPIVADRGQIERIVLNLVTNARDALPDGGTIRVHVEAPADEVLLAVSDDGVGMDEETRSRVFEPFFTTKGAKGTGLGLSTVYGIVKQAHGHIDLTTRLGEGTTVSVALPRNGPLRGAS